MESFIIGELALIFGLAIVILYLCHRLHVPTIVGFLFTGMLVGPHGFGFIKGLSEVEILAEIGIILLLFAIGVEMSLKDLWKIKRGVLLGGSFQVILTTIFAVIVATRIGFSVNESIFMGFLLSLSSTAIVLKLFQKRAELHSAHGRLCLAILLFQDIIVVPMLLVTPYLAGVESSGEFSMLGMVLKGLGIILMVIVSARWVVPFVLYHITKTRDTELFLLTTVVICLSVAWLTANIGLSLALGAFLAGLTISESEYSHQALGNILPFRDLFMSFFFISIGMLLDVSYFLEDPFVFVLAALGVLISKSILASISALLLGFPLRTAVISGLSLAQVGEFSFILSSVGVEYGILSEQVYQLFLVVSILTMAFTSSVMSMSPKIADHVDRMPLPCQLKSGIHPYFVARLTEKKEHLRDHTIIVGFGFNGRTVAKASMLAKIPYVIIDTNPETVRKEQLRGENICYGDATQKAVLEHANIKEARVMVVGISDPAGTRRLVSISHRLNPNLYIIARTQYLQEVDPLYELGASEVIPEEFETSVEIFAHLMKRYLIPRDEVEKLIKEVRADGYEMFRTPAGVAAGYDVQLDLQDVDITTFRIVASSYSAGKSLSHLDLRRIYGVTVLAIRRESEVISNPDGGEILSAGDIIVLLGTPDKLSSAGDLFCSSEEVEEEMFLLDGTSY